MIRWLLARWRCWRGGHKLVEGPWHLTKDREQWRRTDICACGAKFTRQIMKGSLYVERNPWLKR